jgi:hypothetical protein
MNNIAITILIIIAIFIIIMSFYDIHCEKKDFNKGICPRCGSKLYLFDIDSQGGRGYCCRKCPY